VAIVQAGKQPGKLTLLVTDKERGLKQEITINVE
jgi:hypothetical protein